MAGFGCFDITVEELSQILEYLENNDFLKEKELKEETSVKEYLTDLGDGRKFNITFYNKSIAKLYKILARERL